MQGDPRLLEKYFDEYCDPPDLDSLQRMMDVAVEKIGEVEELNIDVEAEVFEHITEPLISFMKITRIMKLNAAEFVTEKPPEVPDTKKDMMEKQKRYPENLIPPGLQVVRNTLSEIEVGEMQAMGRDVLNPRTKFTKPMDTSIHRLIDPYHVLQNPKSVKPIHTDPPPTHLKTHESRKLKLECSLWLEDLMENKPFKKSLVLFTDRLLFFICHLPKESVAFLSKAAGVIYSRDRFPMTLMYYSVLMQASAIKSLWYKEIFKPLVFTRKRKGEWDEEEEEEGEEKEDILIESEQNKPTIDFWTDIGCLDLFKEKSKMMTLNEEELSQCVPADSLLLLRQGIKKITRNLDYGRKKWVGVINQFATVAARSIIVEGDTMAKELFHDSCLRLCFFHVQCLRTFEYISSQPLNKATLGREDLSPNEIHLSQFAELLVLSNTKMELDKRARKHFTDIGNCIIRCPGEGFLMLEVMPWQEVDPVLVRDSVSVGERLLVTNMEFHFFVKLLNDPNLLISNLPESDRDLKTFLAVVCLMFLFLLDFHLQSHSSSGGKKENRFVEDYVKVYPELPKDDAYGTVMFINRQIFVYTQQGMVDTENNLAVTMTLVCKNLREHSRHLKGPATALLASMQNEFSATYQCDMDIEPEVFVTQFLF